MLQSPPLSLYVHLPWCLRKCPYCDFNSHALRGELPADPYVDALLTDLERDLPLAWGRPIQSVFFGGGTPSLFGAAQFERLLGGIRARLTLAPAAEVTIEVNPGTVEHAPFADYLAAGINRFSLGVQSFSDASLQALGRIHGSAEALQAIESLHAAGASNFNIDLMYALPGQDLDAALADVRLAIDSGPTHISHYQLTIEPNTAFHAAPPPLPDEDLTWAMQEACGELLRDAGFVQYEVSAWARPGRACLHNLNYWRYGDFLGIGAGSHGKLTEAGTGTIRRRVRLRHPDAWLRAVHGGQDALAEDRALPPGERIFEFFLNQLRLRDGVRITDFEPRTGVGWEAVTEPVQQLLQRGLYRAEADRLVPTELGWRFGNEAQALFLP
ncbi:MAG: radical SAM family heme chaperone HemW [Xanthomonadales bacterium]|nr:radical SAM family heme chaperone HemW [Xanthomonadales bacterium]